jgi:hypothetical protein
MSTSLFIRRLEQVSVWANRLIKDFDYVNGWYGTVLRQTNPLIEEHALFTLDGDYTTWNVDPYEVAYFQQALAAVWEQREQSLGPSIPLLDSLAGKGRILCFSTCLTTHDGIAIVDSQCFVDESDVPPIDTWFYLQENFLDAHRPTLFCWIPKGFENVMQAAIDAEMMRSYEWLDEIVPVFYATLTTALKAERLPSTN